MDNLDFVIAGKLIREFGYIGLQVRSVSGNFSYVAFIKEEVYNKMPMKYPPGSAIYKHQADFIYSYLEKKWIKENSPISEIQITPAEMVLYGKADKASV